MKRAKFMSVDKVCYVVVFNDYPASGKVQDLYMYDEEPDAISFKGLSNAEIQPVRVRITPAPARRKGKK